MRLRSIDSMQVSFFFPCSLVRCFSSRWRRDLPKRRETRKQATSGRSTSQSEYPQTRLAARRSGSCCIPGRPVLWTWAGSWEGASTRIGSFAFTSVAGVVCLGLGGCELRVLCLLSAIVRWIFLHHDFIVSHPMAAGKAQDRWPKRRGGRLRGVDLVTKAHLDASST